MKCEYPDCIEKCLRQNPELIFSSLLVHNNQNTFSENRKFCGYLFYSLPIQICTFVQEMASLSKGITKCECTLLKLKCVKKQAAIINGPRENK